MESDVALETEPEIPLGDGYINGYCHPRQLTGGPATLLHWSLLAGFTSRQMTTITRH